MKCTFSSQQISMVYVVVTMQQQISDYGGAKVLIYNLASVSISRYKSVSRTMSYDTTFSVYRDRCMSNKRVKFNTGEIYNMSLSESKWY